MHARTQTYRRKWHHTPAPTCTFLCTCPHTPACANIDSRLTKAQNWYQFDNFILRLIILLGSAQRCQIFSCVGEPACIYYSYRGTFSAIPASFIRACVRRSCVNNSHYFTFISTVISLPLFNFLRRQMTVVNNS